LKSLRTRSWLPSHILRHVFLASGRICKGPDKSLAFPIFLFAAQPKKIFLVGLKKLEQSHKCVELRGEYVE
jgi:hypothetical protein